MEVRPASPTGPRVLLQRLWACLQSHHPYCNPQAEKERDSLLKVKKRVPASDTASQEPRMGAVPPAATAPRGTQSQGPSTSPDLIGQHVGRKEAGRPTLSSRDPDEAPDGLEDEQIYRADLLKCVTA